MNDEDLNALVERDPAAAARAFRSMVGGGVNEAPDAGWDALVAALPPQPPRLACHIACVLGRALRFVLYCILTFLRPVVMFGSSLMALFFGLGAVVMFFF